MNFTECSIIWLQHVKLCSLQANVNTILVFYTLKHRELQLIMDTITVFDTLKHNLRFNIFYFGVWPLRHQSEPLSLSITEKKITPISLLLALIFQKGGAKCYKNYKALRQEQCVKISKKSDKFYSVVNKQKITDANNDDDDDNRVIPLYHRKFFWSSIKKWLCYNCVLTM